MFFKILVLVCVIIICDGNQNTLHQEKRHTNLKKLLPNVQIDGLLRDLQGGSPKHHRESRESPQTIIVEEYQYGANTQPNRYKPSNDYYEISVVDLDNRYQNYQNKPQYYPRPQPPPPRGPPFRGPPPHANYHHHHHHGPPHPPYHNYGNQPWNRPGVIPDKFDGTIIIVEETDDPNKNKPNPRPMNPWNNYPPVYNPGGVIKPTPPNVNPDYERPVTNPPIYIPTTSKPIIPDVVKPTPSNVDPGHDKPGRDKPDWNIDDFISGLPDIDSGDNTPSTSKPVTRSPLLDDDSLDPIIINKPTSRPNVFTTPSNYVPPKLDVDIDVRFGDIGNLPEPTSTVSTTTRDPDLVIFSDKRRR